MTGALPKARWQEVAVESSQRPTLPISGHCAARLPSSHSDDVIIFGGYTEDKDKKREANSEAWTFSVQERRWNRVQYADGPVPRVRLAAQCVVVGNALWVIGGWDPGHKKDGGDILSDIWTLDLSSLTWKQVKPEGEELQAISRFQAVAVQQKVYIHTHRSLEDILVLDTAASPPSLRRQRISSSASPSSRGLQSLSEVDGKLWLFGGAPKSGPMLADLWSLDLGSLEWKEHGEQHSQQLHARCSQAAAATKGKVVLFGGAYYREDGPGLAPLGDLWSLNPVQAQWQEHDQQGSKPSPRNAAIMVAVGDKLVLHGGWLAFQETYNDTWVLDCADL